MSPHTHTIDASIAASIASSITTPIPTNTLPKQHLHQPFQQTTTFHTSTFPNHQQMSTTHISHTTPPVYGSHDTFQAPGQPPPLPPLPPPPLPLSQLHNSITGTNNPLCSIQSVSNNDIVMSTVQSDDNISARVSTNAVSDQNQQLKSNQNIIPSNLFSNSSQSQSPLNSSSQSLQKNDSEDSVRHEHPLKMFHMFRNSRKPLHKVSYITQTDKHGWMYRKNKVGNKTNFFLVLDGTNLTVLKSKSGPVRYRVNVRAKPVIPDLERKILPLPVEANSKGKERVIRLYTDREEEIVEWKHALDAAVNSEISDYFSLKERIGCGAYGEVVRAIDLRTKEVRAVKIIKKNNNKKSREHLASEVQIMKSISHPNIVQTYQIFDLKRTIYIAMEYVSGGDLFDYVSQHPNLTEAQASQTMRSIFLAVSYLHSNSIVHRDLKPENILCGNNTWPLQIKVTDFGFSSFADPHNDNTMRTQVGTPYFMAPEILNNEGHGQPVDSWSCGVILYTILTGRLPFAGRNQHEYFTNVVSKKPLFPKILWKDISEDAMRLVKGLLNREPSKRLSVFGAAEHAWVSTPTDYENEITRDRSNLHSSRRRLLKVRQAIIAVAMANRFKAAIPQVVEKVGESTKKVADGIGEGVKKTSKNIGEGTKKVADGIGEGVKKTSKNIGEGTKKVADGIGEGVKKTSKNIGEGTKKVADGIGEGVKKTSKNIGEGTKKVADGIGEGVKKTSKNIGEGTKKVAGGIGEGVKKTADGIEKGVRKTGEGLKRGVDIVRTDRNPNTDGSRTTSHTESGRTTGKRKIFSRRGESKSSEISECERSQHSQPSHGEEVAMSESIKSSVEENCEIERPKSAFYSTVEDHSEMEDESGIHMEDMTIDEYGSRIGASSPTVDTTSTKENEKSSWKQTISMENETDSQDDIRCSREENKKNVCKEDTTEVSSVSAFEGSDSSTERRGDEIDTNHSQPTTSNGFRPNLTPLTGLTVGLSDDYMNGIDTKECVYTEGSDHMNNLRMAAALLLASNANRTIFDGYQ